MTGRFELVEHTADMGVAAEAESLEELFRQAALGLLQVLEPSKPARSQRSKGVRLSGDNPAELLVSWLNEILYLLESGRLLPADFEVHQVTENHLNGTVRGEDFVPEHHELQREVKAATWHQLTLFQANGVWRCRYFLDL